MKLLAFTSLLGAFAVALGAMGSHLIEDPALLKRFEIASRYHFVHVLSLLIIGIFLLKHRSKTIFAAAIMFIAGTLLFCGGLYVYAFSGHNVFGKLVPLGGASLIGGWITLVVGFLLKPELPRAE